jgi:hypothetical protein
MAQSLIQSSFFGGELSPNLYGTVDLAQYKKSAALLRNFFVDYRGGASTRFGTKYVLQAFNSNFSVRLIPFTASFTVTYAMEFGQNYIRFHTNGGPVLESTTAITGINTSTHVITSAGIYNVGDWLYVLAVGGVTGINGNYYIISAAPGGGLYTVTDLYGHDPVWGGAYTSGGTTARVYTIQTPWIGADLALLKFAQNVQFMIFTHPSYPAQLLTYNGPTNWTLTTIAYGTTVPTPTGVSVLQSGGSSTLYDTAYVVTAVDANGQESGASSIVTLSSKEGLGITTGSFSNTVSWSAVSGAIFYNVYRAPIAFHAAGVPAGSVYGLVGSSNGTSFIETTNNFTVPNYSISPPVAQNPFLGGPVASATITAAGVYTTIPTITFAPPSSGGTATGSVTLGIITDVVFSPGSGYHVGDIVYFTHGVVLIVATLSGSGVATFQPLTFPGSSVGSITSGTVPPNIAQIGTSGHGSGVIITVTWGVVSIQINNGGSGYTSAPAITFSSGAAAATAVLGTVGGNPSVPCYFQQRLALASPLTAQQTVYLSTPGSPYNFNTHQIIQPDDAITAPLVSKQLNVVKSMVPMPAGLIIVTATSAWLLNGGSGAGSPVTAINISAQSQAYNGANDVPPIVADDDILYVQAKGAIVRDLRFNFGTQVYTGIDISIMAEHLFFGYQIKEWAWAEEPFKLVWAVRNDGTLLSLTFAKGQEVYGWTHHDTLGLFQSVVSVTESTPSGNVDATYVVVQRAVNGQTLQYVERLADRFMPYGIEDTWALDCAIGSVGATPAATLTPAAASGTGVAFVASASIFSAPQVGSVIRIGGGIATITGFVSGTKVTCAITQPITSVFTSGLPIPQTSGNWTIWTTATTFTGLAQLEGQTVTALADGVVVPGLTVSNGSITLPNPATKVLVGIPYLPQLQTLPLDAGQPTIQGKRKRTGPMSVKVRDTRGLSVGRTFQTLVNIKDGGPPMLSAFPNLVFGDEWVVLDALFDPYGQVCFQQNNPWPATIMAFIPDVELGDTSK